MFEKRAQTSFITAEFPTIEMTEFFFGGVNNGDYRTKQYEAQR